MMKSDSNSSFTTCTVAHGGALARKQIGCKASVNTKQTDYTRSA